MKTAITPLKSKEETTDETIEKQIIIHGTQYNYL